jgi:hypothetical protein
MMFQVTYINEPITVVYKLYLVTLNFKPGESSSKYNDFEPKYRDQTTCGRRRMFKGQNFRFPVLKSSAVSAIRKAQN